MKFNSRERLILKLMGFVLAVALVTEVWDRYAEAKANLILDIESKTSEIVSFRDELEGENPEEYLEEAAQMEEQLQAARERIIELPSEDEASLVVREAISRGAENAGVDVNSINIRKSKTMDESKGMKELRTYFGYDSDLESLLNFFASIEDKPYYMVIDNLAISARRTSTRQNKRARNRNTNRPQRKPLNGNVILASLFIPNESGKIENYESSSSSSTTAAVLDDDKDVNPVTGSENGADTIAAKETEPPAATERPLQQDIDQDDEGELVDPVTSRARLENEKKPNESGPEPSKPLDRVKDADKKPAPLPTGSPAGTPTSKPSEATGSDKKPARTPIRDLRPRPLESKPKPLSGSGGL